MTPTNRTDDFDFDDLPDLPLLDMDEDEQETVPEHPVGELDIPELEEFELVERPVIEEHVHQLDEPEPSEPVPQPQQAIAAPAEEEPSVVVELPQLEDDLEGRVVEEEQQSHPLEPAQAEMGESGQAQESELAEDSIEVQTAEVLVAVEAEQATPSIEPSFELAPEEHAQTQDEPAFVPDPQQIQDPPAPRSRAPLIIGGAVAAALVIGVGVFVLWPGAEREPTAAPVVSAPAEQAVAPISEPTPEPVAKPAPAPSTADLVGDVLSEPQVQVAVVEHPEPEPVAPTQAETLPAVDKPKVAAKPAAPKPAAPKPAPKTEPEKTWQDEALNALDAFENGL